MFDPIQIEKSLNWQEEHREVREGSRGFTKTQTTVDIISHVKVIGINVVGKKVSLICLKNENEWIRVAVWIDLSDRELGGRLEG